MVGNIISEWVIITTSSNMIRIKWNSEIHNRKGHSVSSCRTWWLTSFYPDQTLVITAVSHLCQAKHCDASFHIAYWRREPLLRMSGSSDSWCIILKVQFSIKCCNITWYLRGLAAIIYLIRLEAWEARGHDRTIRTRKTVATSGEALR